MKKTKFILIIIFILFLTGCSSNYDLNLDTDSIDEKLTIHDFRMVPGETHTNLIFDVVKPFECKISDNEMLSTIREKVLEKLPNHFCVIAVDRPYC